ncbi:hypothetical protein ACMT1E_14620 [Sphingomonas flavalba]|uniref:hypothetical protein n=1 Tax=Sphingomonas flavalba TaxID=2559804 RepID=UPI0039DFD851
MRGWIGTGALAAALALAGCDRQPQQQADAPAPAVVDPVAAMKALDPATQLARAVAVVFPDERSRAVRIADQSYVLTPARLVWSGDRPILVSGGQGDDCHACAGTLVVHYLKVADDSFTVERAFPAAAAGTSFGGAPDWQLRDDIASVPVVEARRGGTFQGFTCSRAQLVALTDGGPVTIADDLPIGYSDAGAVTDGKAEEVEGTIVAGARDHDFAIRYSGGVTGTTRYEKAADGAAYTISGKPAAIPAC